MPLPTVTQPTQATLKLELLASGQLVHVETRDWRIMPALKLKSPPGLKLSVYDPLGQTAAMLKRAGVPLHAAQFIAPGAIDRATTALLIGRDALKQPPEGPWREELTASCAAAARCVILEQTEAPDFLPMPLVPAKDRKTTMAFAARDRPPAPAGPDRRGPALVGARPLREPRQLPQADRRATGCRWWTSARWTASSRRR